MLDFISILFIFILDNIPQTTSKGFLIMPYLAYLSYRKDKKIAFLFPLLAVILALHSREPAFAFLFVGINIIFYHLYFINFDYNIGNLYILSLLQIVAWKIFVKSPFVIVNVLFLSVFYFIINLLYMRRATK
ncbi:MAG: hypothetical protein ACRDAG_13125 [Cetobacterium somerae]|jgi:hypothetical protein|uniref:Rod shape-determining protein MreD n=1 Tax=Cetobacterium somerae ATCC BAA-474 TaxID=1319815 RepID=U7VE10_9FUSO|nr:MULTISPECIES: hypothetical protein [Cetobacterium]ERT69374.1 hypothetical protein HMPREF0202_00736 [Cetobacterium somerae ATCC BAA-474]MBC2852875.1 hypothetical protein [Cetobacterium sp. 2G large]MCQ9626254.1 hypothetical protein [Cetobacterium somerae]WVJ01060.1 hypothetical protein VSU16_09730 [Cetobacterium somerae]